MKYFIAIFSLLLLFCSSQNNRTQETSAQTAYTEITKKGQTDTFIYQPKDSLILDAVLKKLVVVKDSPISLRMIKAGQFFMETPYVAHTLESEEEQLVVNLQELDCTTYAENCLALAQAVKQDSVSIHQFANELKEIRYRNNKVDGYFSRLHYFSDWVVENEKKGLVKNVSKEIANTPYNKTVNFMSTHPKSYKQLKNNPELIEKIAEKEKEITAREMYYIPEEKLAHVENQLSEGDIAGITTTIEGLDVSHVVILVRKNDRIYPMHASTLANKVVVDDKTLEEYLLNSKSATGVMVARPL